MKIITSGITASDLEVLKAARDLRLETGGYARENYLMWHTPIIGTIGGADYAKPCYELEKFGLKEFERTPYHVVRENAWHSQGLVWYGKCVNSSALYPFIGHCFNVPVCKNPSPKQLKEFCVDKEIIYIQTGFPFFDIYKEIVEALGTYEQKQLLLTNREEVDLLTSESEEVTNVMLKANQYNLVASFFVSIAIGTVLYFLFR